MGSFYGVTVNLWDGMSAAKAYFTSNNLDNLYISDSGDIHAEDYGAIKGGSFYAPLNILFDMDNNVRLWGHTEVMNDIDPIAKQCTGNWP